MPSCAGFISVVMSITPKTQITEFKTFEECFGFVEEETIEQHRPREETLKRVSQDEGLRNYIKEYLENRPL